MTAEKSQSASILNVYRIVSYAMLALGIISLIASSFSSSYVLAFIGLGLTFWGALLLYVTPSKYVKLELLNSTASSSLVNIERILSTTESDLKGIYLPPRNLTDYTSSLIFIPAKPNEPFPKTEETSKTQLHSKNPSGTFVTPPGLALSKLFEKKLEKPFTETDLKGIQKELPRLFEELQITKKMNIQSEGDTVTIEVTNHIFKDLCQETRKLPKTHEKVGCPLSSAIACALAKTTGKPVTIEEKCKTSTGQQEYNTDCLRIEKCRYL